MNLYIRTILNQHCFEKITLRCGNLVRGTLLLTSVLIASSLNIAQAHPTHSSGDTEARVLVDAAGTGTVVIKMLVEQDDVEIAQLDLAAAYGKGGVHTHGATEYIYIISGVLGNTINGKETVLKPGMITVVKPGEEVSHAVLSKEDVKAILIWTPGGEANTLVKVGALKPEQAK